MMPSPVNQKIFITKQLYFLYILCMLKYFLYAISNLNKSLHLFVREHLLFARFINLLYIL